MNLCWDLCDTEMWTPSGAEGDSSAGLCRGQVATPISICLAFHCDSVSVDAHLEAVRVSSYMCASCLASEHPLRE